MSVRTVIIVGVVLTVLLGILALVTYLTNHPGNDLLTQFTRAATAATAPSEAADASIVIATVEQPTPTFPVSTDGEVTVALEADEHVQVRVMHDGEVVFQELMTPGQRESWSDDEMLIVETGNGAALQVTVNGVLLGPMGSRGEFCTRAWSPHGEISPP
jgi:hypothetical protein